PPVRRVRSKARRTSSQERHGKIATPPSRYDSVSSVAREFDGVSGEGGEGSPGVRLTSPPAASQPGPVAEKMNNSNPVVPRTHEGVGAFGSDGDDCGSGCKAGSSLWGAPAPVEAQALCKGVPVSGPNDAAAAGGGGAAVTPSLLLLSSPPVVTAAAAAAAGTAAQPADKVFSEPTTIQEGLLAARASAASDGGGGGGGGGVTDLQVTQSRKGAERGEQKDLARSISEQSPAWSPKTMSMSMSSTLTL
ncbi:hypothetical protein Vafri_10593, partial [Volvox africanus]